MESATALDTAVQFFTPANIAYTASAALGVWLILATLLWAFINARGGPFGVFLGALRPFSIGVVCLLTIFAAPLGLYYIGKAIWIGCKAGRPMAGALPQ